ncbi:hypothetical protein PhaeoP78_02311 [Phaeobacter inhibens]|nr:hypothetical protein PhaeoP78_02311 [Phaeobacter inhibens]
MAGSGRKGLRGRTWLAGWLAGMGDAMARILSRAPRPHSAAIGPSGFGCVDLCFCAPGSRGACSADEATQT